MIKRTTSRINKAFPLIVFMAFLSSFGCDGSSSSGCSLPQALCGTWYITSVDDGIEHKMVNGVLMIQGARHPDLLIEGTLSVVQKLKHARTRILGDGRTAYLVYAQTMDQTTEIKKIPFASLENLSQEQKDQLISDMKKEVSEKDLNCDQFFFTEKNLQFHCHGEFNEQLSPVKYLMTLEQERLCFTINSSFEMGKSATFPANPDVKHIYRCMRP